jgi:ribosome recycling factor
MNQYITAHLSAFQQAEDYFKKDISSLRTGRINPAMLDNVQVEAYGSRSPINALGNINVSDNASMLISAWDKSVLKDIEKAIVIADLGFSVVNEGERLRISMPPLTEENRRDLVKKLGGKFEQARVELRKIRDEIKTSIEKAFADKEIGEDDKFRFLKELEEEMGRRNDQLKVLSDHKEKDIMTI